MQIKLAEALLRRKELAAKTAQIGTVKASQLFEIKTQRTKAHEGIDDVIAQVPKLELNQVTAEFDFYARALRHVDAAIQQANWTTSIEVPDQAMSDYKSPPKQ